MSDIFLFFRAWFSYFKKRFLILVDFFTRIKSGFTYLLYRRRGKLARPVSHFGIGLLVVLGIAVSPLLSFEKTRVKEGGELVLGVNQVNFSVLGAENSSSQRRGGLIEYQVSIGDTVSSIAQKFGVSLDTIRWVNDLKSINDIRQDQTLKILPISGVLHTVRRGETVNSIAKIYSASSQAIVDFPFNTFTNDETFALAVGQDLIVPEGVMPKVKIWSKPSLLKPLQIAATTATTGQYIWPTVGKISQGYHWYHKAIDIADSSAPAVVASRGGQVITAGWVGQWSYGIHVIIDHGGGYSTLYGHLSSVSVSPGQSVLRGQVIGRMGSTGRSTGTHLHFEVRTPAGNANPLSYLK